MDTDELSTVLKFTKATHLASDDADGAQACNDVQVQMDDSQASAASGEGGEEGKLSKRQMKKAAKGKLKNKTEKKLPYVLP